MFIHSILTNPRFQWDIVGKYFGDRTILAGLVRTLEFTALGMIGGTLLGVVLASMRLSNAKILKWVSGAYIWVFRSIPLLVLLVVFYNIAALYPKISVGIPFGPEFYRVNVNSTVTPFVAGLVVMVMHEAAYMAEIVRAGILSVGPGQTEASQALGMRPRQIFLGIVLPQAMRAIVPPTVNQTITALMATSQLSVIAYSELFYSAQTIYARNYEVIPLLLVATLWYLVVTSVLTVCQRFVERYYGRGAKRLST